MSKIHAAVAAAALACAMAPPSRAQSSDELKEIRARDSADEEEYEGRIEAL